MKKIVTLIILSFALSTDDIIKTESYNVFILDTEDLNNNGINDALTFSGKNLINTATIYDLRQSGLNKIWDYTLPEDYVGYFTDAVFADLKSTLLRPSCTND